MSEWIKCTDRLPEIVSGNTSNNVLIICDEGILVARIILYRALNNRKTDEYKWSEQSTGCGCCAEDITPTHWMTLPEPPKELYDN